MRNGVLQLDRRAGCARVNDQQEMIAAAAAIIRRGGLVGLPTETVYGLAANALDAEAVARVFAAKDRPSFDPLIVHIADAAQAADLATSVPGPLRRLADRYWPGPLTLVLPKREVVPDIVTSGLPTVAVRVPDHALARDLIRAAGVPIAAPSANLFGRLSPTTAAHVADQLGDRVDIVVDGGPCRVGVESTVVAWVDDHCVLLRPGGLALEDVAAVVGDVNVPPPTEQQRLSPGRMPRHYQPTTPLELHDQPPPSVPPGRVGRLTFAPAPTSGYTAVETLSPSGDLHEAAANLFAALRRLDAMGLDRIVATRAPGHGLGRAINDRLTKASETP